MYYWKTNYTVSDQDENSLKKWGITKLYVRVFDVDWDKEKSQPMPVSPITFTSRPADIEIIPVVYIPNKVMLTLTDLQVNQLSKNIFNKIESICGEHNINYKEIQLDCDWSSSSREKYFKLLTLLKQEFRNKRISATLRLHQVKYYKKTGIPPVDKGMLMFYNMGKINTNLEKNPIYNREDAEKYVSALKSYPFHYDVVLPCFSWSVQIRDHRVLKLWDRDVFRESEKNSNFSRETERSLVADTSFFSLGIYFKQRDRLRLDELNAEETVGIANYLSKYVSPKSRTIAIFDFNPDDKAKFNEEILDNIFTHFE